MTPMQVPDYRIVQAPTLEALEGITQDLIASGWQPAGSIGQAQGVFYHEMILFPQPMTDVEKGEKIAEEAFADRLEGMDKKVKELLDINNIKLSCQKGKFVTTCGSKVYEGINPTQVLNLLKSSKHCPIDLDEAKVIQAIERII